MEKIYKPETEDAGKVRYIAGKTTICWRYAPMADTYGKLYRLWSYRVSDCRNRLV